MSVAPSEALERSVLEGKDREQLLTIAAALGVKPAARAKKADIIDKILEQVGVPTGASTAEGAPPARKPRGKAARAADDSQASLTLDGAAEPASADAEPAPLAPVDAAATALVAEAAPAAVTTPAVVLGPDGEPLAEWELEFGDDGDEGDDGPGGEAGAGSAGQTDANGEPREGRRRRRRRNRNRTGEDGAAVPGATPATVVAAPVTLPVALPVVERVERPERSDDQRVDLEALSNEPIEVAGHVDLRDEGFGFLRVRGYLASRDDIYVSVKQVRQFGLRKGDHVVGTSRPAGRNEKNPALLSVVSVNGGDPDAARSRRRFDDLTPVSPDTLLQLEAADGDVTARVIDLVAPIGRGQRALVAAPPRAGKTTVLRTIAMAIERNHPDVRLMVLLVDERPEEVTDMRRAVQAEVVASTFDGKPTEHTQVAEMVIEKAKRLVEAGEHVVVIADGLTRLARAYNLAIPGRVVNGGVDATAVHPAKRFFGAARRAEEGGSLTVIATALVDTGSATDEAIFEELVGAGTMELRLDRRLAELGTYPAIDIAASGTRHEDRLYDAAQLARLHGLRRVLADSAAAGSAGPIGLLLDRIGATADNAALLGTLAG